LNEPIRLKRETPVLVKMLPLNVRNHLDLDILLQGFGAVQVYDGENSGLRGILEPTTRGLALESVSQESILKIPPILLPKPDVLGEGEEEPFTLDISEAKHLFLLLDLEKHKILFYGRRNA